MWGDDDFQKDVDKLKYRKRVRETAERQYEVDKFVSVMMWMFGGVGCLVLFGLIGSMFVSTPSKQPDRIVDGSTLSDTSSPAAESLAEGPSPSTGPSGEGAEAETGRSVDSFPTVDIGSIPESVDPTLCLNAISRAQARAGRDWMREISAEVAARCRREIEVQRRRDKQ